MKFTIFILSLITFFFFNPFIQGKEECEPCFNFADLPYEAQEVLKNTSTDGFKGLIHSYWKLLKGNYEEGLNPAFKEHATVQICDTPEFHQVKTYFHLLIFDHFNKVPESKVGIATREQKIQGFKALLDIVTHSCKDDDHACKETIFSLTDSNGNSLSHFTATKDYTVEVLKEKGIKLDAKNEQGQTAAHWRAESCNHEALKALYKYGVNITEKDFNGRSPLDYAAARFQRARQEDDAAMQKKCEETLKFLEEALKSR